MSRYAKVAASVVFLSFLPASANAASAKTECKEFQVISTGEFRKIHYVDLDESGGTSAGDRMIGYRVLQNEAGDRIGERFFTGLIHEVNAQGKEVRRTTEVVNVFPEGAIYTTKERVAGVDLPASINGGTGTYAGVTGFVKVSRAGTSNVYHFRVSCPPQKAS